MENSISSTFDDIRPLNDNEVENVITELISDSFFRRTINPLLRTLSWEQFCAVLKTCKSKDEFQRTIIYPILKQLINETTSELKGFGWKNLKGGNGKLFISNHRDIVLDAAFLNILMFDKGKPTTEIAIGDNLLIYPWIEKLVRLNKSFIVKRNVSLRQMLKTSKHLSDYIHETISSRSQPVWLAQREGRAKDSNDKTQGSLIKMLTLHNSTQSLSTLKELHITPLSISYEIDPCDFLKAKEYQLRRDNPKYKKTKSDDLLNMITGIKGEKGRVHFRFGNPINKLLEYIPADTPKNELIDKVSRIIDHEIYRNYSFFPRNYVAYDLMTDGHQFKKKYTQEDKDSFERYLDAQINKIDLPNRDDAFLRDKMIKMYGNTVKNSLLVP